MSKLPPVGRVLLVGVGGATCSGKTTLAKHLRSLLPNSVIIHQDDFAPPEELIPIHPVHNVADWDAPQGAIDWPRLRAFLKSVKENGVIPPDHRSHDHLNEQKDIPISDSVRQELTVRFQQVEDEQREKGIRVIWGLVDGFLLYWDQDVIDQLDVRFFLRTPHDVIKQRRHERHGYHTAGKYKFFFDSFGQSVIDSFPTSSLMLCYTSIHVCRDIGMAGVAIDYTSRSVPRHPSTLDYPFGVQFNPEGSLWRDPPMYWEHIVYPAYVEAHRDIFENGDVESGKSTGQRVQNLVVIESVQKGAELSMDDIVRRCCDVLGDFVHGFGG